MTDNLIASNDRLESILVDRIGNGPAQTFLTRSIFTLLFVEGSESIVLGLLLPVLTAEWNISTSEKSYLIALVYLGVTIGSLIQSYSDVYGRYNFLLLNAVITTIFGFLSCICDSFVAFVIVRFFYGIGIGIILPVSATYITQIEPGYMRATKLVISRVFWSLGSVFACIIGWLTRTHWRILLLILNLPNILAVIDLYRNGVESLRYLWSKRDVDGVYEILSLMAQKNGRKALTKQEIIDEMNSHQFRSQGKSWTDLFEAKYIKQTIIFLAGWFSCCFIYYGVMLFLPTILARQVDFSENFKYLFLIVMSVVEVISFCLCNYIIDHPSFGRKKTVIYLFLLIGLMNLLLLLFSSESNFVLLVVFVAVKVFITTCFMAIYPYTAEVYETLLRSQALGVCSCIGRIATSILGLVGLRALEWFDGLGLYLLFVVLSFVSCGMFWKMPYCTLGRDLDA